VLGKKDVEKALGGRQSKQHTSQHSTPVGRQPQLITLLQTKKNTLFGGGGVVFWLITFSNLVSLPLTAAQQSQLSNP
jgi:hypothetical protein